MSHLEFIKQQLEKWQAAGWVHPLTCGNDSNHGHLLPIIEDDKIILVCPDCDYRQVNIPAYCCLGPGPNMIAKMETYRELADDIAQSLCQYGRITRDMPSSQEIKRARPYVDDIVKKVIEWHQG